MSKPLKSNLARICLVASLCLGTGAIAAACGANPQPTEYGEKYEENFMFGCTGVDPNTGEVPDGGQRLLPEDECVCVYDGLKEKIPFDEAKQFEEEQSEADSGDDIKIPDNIDAIFKDCTGSSARN